MAVTTAPATSAHRHAVRRLISTPGRIAARFAVLVVSGYLSQMSETVLTNGDRMILGAQGLDARPLFVAATVVGVLYAFEPRASWLRWCWLVLFTLTSWGRALSLLIIGSPELDRTNELEQFVRWVIVFLAGVFASLILTIAALLDAE